MSSSRNANYSLRDPRPSFVVNGDKLPVSPVVLLPLPRNKLMAFSRNAGHSWELADRY